MRTVCSLLIATCFALVLAAQAGHELQITIDGYQSDTLFLGYYMGDKQYLRDTTVADAEGTFTFSGDEPLPGGMYLVVMQPDNNFFQLLLNEQEQRFSVHTNAADPINNVKIQGSKDNSLFYDYLHFINVKRPEAEQINQQLSAAEESAAARTSLQAQLDEINQQVADYQQRVIREHPESLTAAIIKANQNIDLPQFEGSKEEVQVQNWRYMQQHFWDKIDLSDPRLLRTPFLFERTDYFVHKLQVQHPDTIARAIDVVLEKMEPAEESFRYYLVHFLNESARSKIVGMDAVYVHLADKYYKSGKADWAEDESLQKIVENAETLKPLLIGKIAPNITLQKRDGSAIALHDVKSDYTVLYFWRYDCGHCKESTPFMKDFYNNFKDKGVELFAVCVKFTDDVPACWEYVDENEIGDWLHTVDPYQRSRFPAVYNIKSTPQLYILDSKKEIISKRIGAEQLEEVMSRLMELEEEKNKAGD